MALIDGDSGNNPNLNGTNDDDTINGFAGNDTLSGFDGDDILNGDAGRDVLFGGFEDDLLNGGSGVDILNGGSDEDTLNGGSGRDTLNGDDGDDALDGGDGRDILNGGADEDSLSGSFGNDILNGGAGDDVITGGAGSDRFVFNTNNTFDSSEVGIDEITDFTLKVDKIVLDLTTFTALKSVSGSGFSVPAEFQFFANNQSAGITTSAALITYSDATGNLFYNQNGSAPGFGTGGQFATLTGGPLITANDFIIEA